MSKKNNKKNLKKVQAKIGTTPVKAEAAKKEESKAAVKNTEIAAAKDDAKAKKKAEKKAHEEAKYAASKARAEARNARKKSIMDKLIDSKKEKASEPVKITLEDRLKKEERRNVAMARHIASVTRRCKRMHLNDADTKKVIDIAKKQWDNATVYNITVVCDSVLKKKKKELEKLVKDCGIKSACITNSTAFFKDVPASVVAKLRDLVGNATFYQYCSDSKSPFEEAGIDMSGNHNKHKKGGDPHTIECSKNASVNFYNLRKAKKKAKETLEKNTYNFRHGSKAEGRKLRRGLKVEAKAVNKKPTQVKEIRQKSAKQAA